MEKFINKDLKKNDFLINKKINLIKTLRVDYDREYFVHKSKKLRFTLDKNIRVFVHDTNKILKIDKNILEVKFSPTYRLL